MRVLYYLEPYVEFDKPLFRMATVRNHFESEMRGLLAARARDVEITLLCSEQVAKAVRDEQRLPGVRLVSVTQAELWAVYPDYLEASSRFYNRDHSEDAMERAVLLYRRKLVGHEPDVVVCYESNAPFLAKLFPNALFLHNTLGIFSRAPYPPTSMLDPFGIGKDSYLARCGQVLSQRVLTSTEQTRLERFKLAAQRAQTERSPVVRAAVRRGFERVVLLPLQVSKYFMFDENLPDELRGVDQLGLLEYVLAQCDPKIGMHVTMHASDAAWLTPELARGLRARFPNFLFDPAIQAVASPSQHVLPHVDGVVSVSSAVGLLSLVWDLPLVALGRSHLTGIAAGRSVRDLSALLSSAATSSRDGLLYELLTTYYPQMDRFHHQGDWYRAFLADLHARRREACVPGYFRNIADPELVFDALTEGLSAGPRKTPSRASVSVPANEVTPLRSKMQRADVVSFDVFDTLVARPLLAPHALFELIANRATAVFAAHDVSLADHGGFSRLRREAAKHAALAARAAGSEEYSLNLVYEWMAQTCGAPTAVVAELKLIEEQAEIKSAQPRPAGHDAFQLARSLNKRILLISDTYLDSRVVSELVARCGYAGFERLFTSSDFGKLKRSGTLFKHLRGAVGTGSRWLHLGDNPISDVRMPANLGIDVHHVPSASTNYLADALVRETFPLERPVNSLGMQIAHGVIANKYFDRPENKGRAARFGGSPYRLGFEGAGPLFLGFGGWILDEARREGITDLYFLARDGLLPKQVCDLLKGEEESVRTHYVWASRRAYTTAALQTPADVLGALGFLFRSSTVRSFFEERFGLSEGLLAEGSLQASGFHSFDDVLRQESALDMERLRRLVTANMDFILRSAERERENLLRYLDEVGLTDPARKIALVDIGHNASLQVALARLLGRDDLTGLYFATFRAARLPHMAGHKIRSYLLEYEDGSLSEHPYARNLGIFEFIFLPAERSFLKFDQSAAGELVPKFAEADESARFAVVSEAHRGVRDFVKAACEASLGRREALELSKNEATHSFLEYASEPDREDAALLTGVGFASGLGTDAIRYVIAPEHFGPRVLSESWWHTGAEVVYGVRRTRKHAEENPGAALRRKLLKLQRDPRRFVEDMRLMKTLKKLLD